MIQQDYTQKLADTCQFSRACAYLAEDKLYASSSFTQFMFAFPPETNNSITIETNNISQQS